MPPNIIKVPNDFLSDGDMLDYLYPDIHIDPDIQAAATKAVLWPKNVNAQAMQKFPGAVMCLESSACFHNVVDDDAWRYQ